LQHLKSTNLEGLKEEYRVTARGKKITNNGPAGPEGKKTGGRPLIEKN